jgi:hypothetical protein
MNVHVSELLPNRKIEPHFDAHQFVLSSFARAIEGAPPENRRKVFRLVAHDSFQRCCDDLRELATESGLIDLVGAVSVEDDLRAAFVDAGQA